VVLRDKTVLFHEPVLKGLNVSIKNFDTPAAFNAHQMIVVVMLKQVLVPRCSVFEPDLAAQAALAEQFQGTVYGGKTYRRVFRLDRGPNIFNRDMLFHSKENLKYPVARFAVFKVFFHKEFLKNRLFIHYNRLVILKMIFIINYKLFLRKSQQENRNICPELGRYLNAFAGKEIP
jgi:hypothetical protein